MHVMLQLIVVFGVGVVGRGDQMTKGKPPVLPVENRRDRGVCLVGGEGGGGVGAGFKMGETRADTACSTVLRRLLRAWAVCDFTLSLLSPLLLFIL